MRPPWFRPGRPIWRVCLAPPGRLWLNISSTAASSKAPAVCPPPRPERERGRSLADAPQLHRRAPAPARTQPATAGQQPPARAAPRADLTAARRPRPCAPPPAATKAPGKNRRRPLEASRGQPLDTPAGIRWEVENGSPHRSTTRGGHTLGRPPPAADGRQCRQASSSRSMSQQKGWSSSCPIARQGLSLWRTRRRKCHAQLG